MKKLVHTTEDNDHSYDRMMMRVIKTEQYTWIFVGNGSHASKILSASPRVFLRLLADHKDILRDRNCFI